MERIFNIARENMPEDNYAIDPLKRFDLDDILIPIRQKRYYVLHDPQQTGNPLCMLALRDYLNKSGGYYSICTCNTHRIRVRCLTRLLWKKESQSELPMTFIVKSYPAN